MRVERRSAYVSECAVVVYLCDRDDGPGTLGPDVPIAARRDFLVCVVSERELDAPLRDFIAACDTADVDA